MLFSLTLTLVPEVNTGSVRSKLTVMDEDNGLSRPPDTIAALKSLLPSTPKLARFCSLNCALRPLADRLIRVANKSLLVKVFCASSMLLPPSLAP